MDDWPTEATLPLLADCACRCHDPGRYDEWYVHIFPCCDRPDANKRLAAAALRRSQEVPPVPFGPE